MRPLKIPKHSETPYNTLSTTPNTLKCHMHDQKHLITLSALSKTPPNAMRTTRKHEVDGNKAFKDGILTEAIARYTELIMQARAITESGVRLAQT